MFAHNRSMQKQGENVFTRTVRGGGRRGARLRGTVPRPSRGRLCFFSSCRSWPFLFWLTLLFGGAEGLFEKVMELELFGWARDLLTFLRDNAQGATAGASVFLIATTLWSSSRLFLSSAQERRNDLS